MSCTNLSNNLEIKNATFNLLSSIYKYTGNINYLPVPNSIFNTNNKDFYDNKNINTDLDKFDEPEGKENLITVDENDNIYINCVYQSSLPWYTTSENKKKCEVIPEIKLPENRLILDKKSSTITPIFKSSNKEKSGFCSHATNINKAYCENTGYDWIITPNYYLGNTYYKDNSHYTDADVYKCYAPCEGDFMPYTKTNGELKCIPKKFFNSGIFSNKYMFSSFGLINLIGNIALSDDEKNNENTNLLFILHRLIIEYNLENNYDKELYDKNVSIYNDHIDAFNKNNYTDLYKEFKDVIEKIIFKNFTTNTNQDYYNINEFTYKHRKFNEQETEMYSFNGLDVCKVLIDPVLIHTWMLANLFQPLNDDIIKPTSFINGIISASQYDSSRKANKKKAKESLLYDKLYTIFKDADKAIRLKNIFFKAVNNCYNSKTNFSVNIIERTKIAFNNDKIIKIILDKNYYYLTNNIYIANYINIGADATDLTYPLAPLSQYPKDKYILCINYILNQERFTDFIEYPLLKDVDIIGKKTTFDNTSSVLASKFNDLYFKKADDDKDENLWIYKYYFSMERLERPTCEKGYEWNPKYSTCDVIKKYEKEEDKEVEENDFQIPELKNILSLFVQIILIIIVIYIIYIFYDIFGEVIYSIYNAIVVYYTKSKSYLYKTLNKGDKYENIVNNLEYDKELIENDYKQIEGKYLKIDEYMKK
jgi:hypothetical protein